MTAYKAHQLRSQFLKSYSVVQQVFKQMESEDIAIEPSAYTGVYGPQVLLYKEFKKFLTGYTDCGTWSVKSYPCANVNKLNYKTFNKKSVVSRYYFDDGQLALPDGTLLIFEQGAATDYIWVFVDINGYKNPPNVWGYDLFTFEFLDGELRTMGDKQTTYNDLLKYCDIKSDDAKNGIACAYRAKTESDYFKWVIKNVK